MEKLLERCDQNYKLLPCCHKDQRKCNCYKCLKEGFWDTSDTYNCEKKMHSYVLNYGPSYASEIYHYLSYSQILHHVPQKILNILSIGCGFAPDLIAVEKYISDNNLTIQFRYHGIDLSEAWKNARYLSKNAKFHCNDATKIKDYFKEIDLVFIVKFFSTLFKNNNHQDFLNSFIPSVINTMKNDCIVVFNDINSVNMGRDVFHQSIQHLFSQNRNFYFDNPPWVGHGWNKIPLEHIVFNIPPNLSYQPLSEIRQTVCFEYRK